MKRYLLTHTWAAGLNESQLITPIPALAYGQGKHAKYWHVASIIGELSITWTAASTSDAVAQRQYLGIIRSLGFQDAADNYIGMGKALPGAAFRVIRAVSARQAITKGDATATTANGNTTHTKKTYFSLPFMVSGLADAGQPMPLVSRLRKSTISWNVASLFATGNTITAASLKLYAVCVPKRLAETPELVWDYSSLTKWNQHPVTVDGKPLFIGLADLAAGATTTFGSTDFTDAEIEAAGCAMNRCNVDAPCYELNLDGSPADDYALPTSGSADFVPLFVHRLGADVGDVLTERNVNVTLVTGAGNPGLTDQSVLTCVLKTPNAVAQVDAIGASELPMTRDEAARRFASAELVQGRAGAIRRDGAAAETAAYLRKPV